MTFLRSFFLLSVLFLRPWNASAQEGPAPVTLQPGDLIRVTIWREEDLSGEFLVNSSGVVTLPLLGDRNVLGRSIPDLQEQLVNEYRTELRNPSISLTPLRRISVLGEVRQPNVYVVDPTVTVATAVALAGGATPSGNLDKISIRRGDRVIRYRVGATQTLQDVDVRSGDEIIVEPESWFIRNSTILFSTGVSVMLFTVSLLMR